MWTREDKDALVLMYKSGESVEEIAKELCRPPHQVSRMCIHMLNIGMARPQEGHEKYFKPALSEDQKATIREMHERGAKHDAIAKAVGVNVQVLISHFMWDANKGSSRTKLSEWGCEVGTPSHNDDNFWSYGTEKLLERIRLAKGTSA